MCVSHQIIKETASVFMKVLYKGPHGVSDSKLQAKEDMKSTKGNSPIHISKGETRSRTINRVAKYPSQSTLCFSHPKHLFREKQVKMNSTVAMEKGIAKRQHVA